MAGEDHGERLARVESWKDGHEDQCKERYQDIKNNTNNILTMMTSLSNDMKAAVTRLHERGDGQDAKIASAKIAAERQLSTLKTTGLVALVSLLIGVVGYLLVNGTPWHNAPEHSAAIQGER